MYINKVMIYGNLTRDPESRALPSGMSVCSFSVATNRTYTDRDGKRQESADYHNIVVFGKQGENCSKYLHKGSGAFVEGRLQTRSWEKDGQKQYRTEIVADRVQFGPRTGGGGAPSNNNNTEPSKTEETNNPQTPSVPDYPEEEISPEDIPF